MPDTCSLPELPRLTPAGERILHAATTLFYADGIRATGVDAIAQAAGTTKKTLYDAFGAKDQLVATYLLRRAWDWQAFLTDRIEHQRGNIQRVLAVFDALASWHAASTRGCAFVNAYAELSAEHHPALGVIRAEKNLMRQRFVGLVEEADVLEAARIGRAIHLLYEGLIVMSTVAADAEAHASAWDTAERLLTTELDSQEAARDV